jgi:hypothetical protein
MGYGVRVGALETHLDVGALPAKQRVSLRDRATTLVVDLGGEGGDGLDQSYSGHAGSHCGQRKLRREDWQKWIPNTGQLCGARGGGRGAV